MIRDHHSPIKRYWSATISIVCSTIPQSQKNDLLHLHRHFDNSTITKEWSASHLSLLFNSSTITKNAPLQHPSSFQETHNQKRVIRYHLSLRFNSSTIRQEWSATTSVFISRVPQSEKSGPLVTFVFISTVLQLEKHGPLQHPSSFPQFHNEKPHPRQSRKLEPCFVAQFEKSTDGTSRS